jgi:hypothetical protein
MPAPRGHKAYNLNGEGGRPYKYSHADIEKFADEFLEWIKVPTNFWFKDFALEKNIHPEYMVMWAKENERFNNVYRLAKEHQESRILKGGMTKVFGEGLTKFVLVNKHGYADKSQQHIISGVDDSLSFLLKHADGKSKDLVNEN